MKVGFLGGGNMATAIVKGLVDQGYAANTFWICDRHPEKLTQLQLTLGVNTTDSPIQLFEACDTIVLAVKPQSLKEALTPLKDYWQQRHSVISVAAGVQLKHLEALCGARSIIRAMPNTPVAIQQGATALCANEHCHAEDKSLAERLFNAVGLSVWVDQEEQMDAVTALSGSGPAYYFLFIESMIAAATELGLPPEVAKKLALKTAQGACEMAATSSREPAQLRAEVTSKGGTTAAALDRFNSLHLSDIVKEALKAAKDRSQELSDGF